MNNQSLSRNLSLTFPLTFPLTLAQSDIYFDQLQHHQSPLYNVGGIIRMGQIDPGQIQAAHQALITGDDVFGLRMTSTEQTLAQTISDQRTTDLPQLDFSTEAEPQVAANQWLKQLFETPMAIDDAELFRAALLKIADNQFWYVGISHHLAMDGWGFSNWASRLGQLYDKGVDTQIDGSQSGLWQTIAQSDQDYLSSQKYQSDRDYWLQQTAALNAEKLLTPYYQGRDNEGKALASDREVVTLSPVQMANVSAFARDYRVGVSHIFLAVLASYFSTAYTSPNLVFGLPFHNRKNHRQKQMLGVFTGISPMTIEVAPQRHFVDLVKQLGAQQKANMRHQRYPIGHLINELKGKGEDKSLYDIGFNYLKLDSRLDLPGSDGHNADLMYISHNHEVTPLMATVWEYGEGRDSEIQLDYNVAYFSESEIQLLGGRLSALLDQLLQQPEAPLGQLSLLPNNEYQQLLKTEQAPKVDYAQDALIHQLFEQQVVQNPDQLAVVFEQKTLTYAALNQASNRLAHYLKAQGVGPDTLVGLCVERSVEMVIGILAILKAGGAYVPLDPTLPTARLEYMIKDTGVTQLLTQSHLADLFAAVNDSVIICLDSEAHQQSMTSYSPTDLNNTDQQAHHLAYVIYTSGSTGQPKGVMVEHQALVNRIDWMQNSYALNSTDRVLQKTPYNFDVSVWEFVWTLGYGATLVVAKPEGHKDPEYLAQLMAEQQVTTLHFVPSMLNAFLAAEQAILPASVRQVFCSGEALEVSDVKTLQQQSPHVALHNLYGPTEAAIDVSYFDCGELNQHNSVPIGRPIQNIHLLVLDKNLNRCAIGVPGELHIQGHGLARGYLNQPELTAERFIVNPFHQAKSDTKDEARLYKTGDLARYLPDGNLAYLGRIDDQVKIRGLRIELGEIAYQLMQCAKVSSATVLAREDQPGQPRLVAYVIGDAQPESLKQALLVHLPDYMVPSAFVFIDAWPLTPNGKINRKALPAPDIDQLQGAYIAPQTSTEQVLAQTWATLLQLDVNDISTTANFFALGGNSLQIIQYKTLLREHGFDLPMADLYGAATLAELALTLTQHQSQNIPPVLIPSGCTQIEPDMLPMVDLSDDHLRLIESRVPAGAANIQDIYPLSSLQQGMLFHALQDEGSDPYLMKTAFKCHSPASYEQFVAALRFVISRHDSLRTQMIFTGLPTPVQVVCREVELSVTKTCWDKTQAPNDIDAWLRDYQLPQQGSIFFDQAPLMRLQVFVEGDDHHILLYHHHAVEDNLSIQVIQADMAAHMAGDTSELTPVVAYRDFVWQGMQLNRDKATEHFTEQLAGFAELSAPFGIVSQSQDALSMLTHQGLLSKSLVSQLNQLATQHAVSLSVVLHYAWALLVAQGSGKQDVVFGSVMSGRMLPVDNIEQLVGLCINTLPVRVQLAQSNLADGFKQVQRAISGLIEYEQAPLSLAQNASEAFKGNALFTTVLNCRLQEEQHAGYVAPTYFDGDKGVEYLWVEEHTNYPFSVSIDSGNGELMVNVVAHQPIAPQRVFDYFETVLRQLLVGLTNELPPLLTSDEQQTLEKMQAQMIAPPSESVAVAYTAPANDTEQHLVEIYSSLLGLEIEQVSTSANFFELGGDSILSTLVVAQATAIELHFSVQDLYAAPTIRQLAALAQSDSQVLAPQEAVTGLMPLLPIQRLFFNDDTDWYHFNQSVMLTTPVDFDTAALTAIVEQLYQRHDALRLMFNLSDEGWQAAHQPFCASMVTDTLTVKQWADPTYNGLTDYANEVQQSLNPAKGQLFKLVAINKAEDTGRLLLVCHHLVIDGLSWRILFKDIETLYGQWLAKAPLSLPPKTASYQQWGEFLTEYASREVLLNERDYWLESFATPVTPLAQFSEQTESTGRAEVSFKLNRELTGQLLNQTNKVYRSEINELLLAGLLLAVQRWSGTPTTAIRLDLEGHGRQPLNGAPDLTQTVGWFSTLYPLTLTLHDNRLASAICAVKEQYRSVPEKGIGFGVMQHSQHDSAFNDLPARELLFNYLGQIDQTITGGMSGGMAGSEGETGFALADESTGPDFSPNRAAWHPLALNGLVSGGQLGFTLDYDLANYATASMQALLDAFAQALTDIVHHCRALDEAGTQGRYSPVDFPQAKVNATQLTEFVGEQTLIDDLYPASGMQQGLLFHSMLETGSYVMQMQMSFAGLNSELYQQAWQQVINRHSVFRTAFVGLASGNAHQLVLPEATMPWQFDDLSAVEASQQAQQIETLRLADKAQGFDANVAPMMRMRLIELGEQRQQLIWSFHHALLDGWCLPIVFAEVIECYRALRLGQTPQLPAAPLYRDYTAWLAAQDQPQANAFWTEQLAQIDTPTPLPLAGVEQPDIASGLHELSLDFNEQQTAQLTHLAQSAKTTVNVLLQGAWSLLLSRYSGQQQVVFAAISAGRPAQLTGVERMVGLFINTLPVVVNVDEQLPLNDWLQQLHHQQVAREEYHYLPLSEIQRLSPAGTDLFDSLLVFENFPLDTAINAEAAKAGLNVEQINTFTGTNYGITITAQLTDKLGLHLELQKQQFSAEQMVQIAGHLEHLLLDMVNCTQVNQVAMLSPQQNHHLLETLNDTAGTYAKDQLIHQLFESEALRVPDAIAVVCGEQQLNFAELNQAANRLAHLLIEEEAGQDCVVGLYLGRSVEMMVALLAILKAGAAYLPLDPHQPKERLQYMMADAGVEVVLTSADLLDGLPADGIDMVLVDHCERDDFCDFASTNPELDGFDSSALAYILYTSGSTGLPKGVCVEHHQVNHYLAHCQSHYFNPASGESLAGAVVSIPLTFDATVTSVLSPLTVGKKVVLLPEEQTELFDGLLEHLLDSNENWLFKLTPTHLQALSAMAHNRAAADNGHVVVLGGEQLTREGLAVWQQTLLPQTRFINEYGPTETVVGCSVYEVNCWQDMADLPVIPIGKPINNTRLYVLDQQQRLLPLGATGELYIGGAGVTRGYQNLTEMTAERFITSAFVQGERLYRSGDLVRYLADGNLEFIGRVDDQVKIRGFRIELGEIEHQLNGCEGVDSAQVLLREDEPGQPRLVAYVVVTADNPAQAAGLKQALSERLAEYMIPSAFVFIDQWPLTHNGKTDKKALPAPDDIGGVDGAAEYIAPQNALEKALVDIWSTLLNVEDSRLSTRANFFELGGDSILSIQLVSRAAQAGLHFSVKDLFAAPSIEQLAPLVKSKVQVSAPQGPVSGAMPLLPIQRDFLLDDTDMHHFNQAVMLTTPADFDQNILSQMVFKLYQRHDALRQRFSQNEGHWQADYLPLSDVLVETAVEVSTLDEMAVDTVQQSLRPELGQLFKAVYFTPTEGAGRLLLVIHHLAVDGVSWRILLQDIETLYGQWQTNKTLNLGADLKLEPKTSSYQQWGVFLEDYAHSASLHQQREYWLETCATPVTKLADRQVVVSGASGIAETGFSLDQGLTAQLLTQASQAYRSQINELLLAALLMSVHRFADMPNIRIDLEGHGREMLSDELDLSQTVGWFTSIFPLTLGLADGDCVEAVICAVKEQYRAIPENGIGFGLLKQLSRDKAFNALPASELVFNYLGQFDQTVNANSYFTQAAESVGQDVSTARTPGHPLALNGMVTGGKLGFKLSFDQSVYDPTAMAQWMTIYRDAIEQVIDHCVATERGCYTPSDFELAQVSKTELDLWQASEVEIDDLYPASGMQQGLLFQSMMATGSYVTQSLFTFEGLDIGRFQQAWQQVVQRHSIFRTGFVGLNSANTHQLVLPQATLPWRVEDLTEADSTMQAQQLEALRLADKAEGFDFEQAPLMRMTLAKLDSAHTQLIWSYHHALLDGWCMSLIFADVAHFYQALNKVGSEQSVAALPAAPAYRDYARWLAQQDIEQAKAFWSEQLAVIEELTPLPLASAKSDSTELLTQLVDFSVAETAQLVQLAQSAHTTVNVLLQGAWSLLLSRYSGKHQVVFGAITSGRPAELVGVEQMVGLFINTLPTVVQVPEQMPLIGWLQQLHGQLVERESCNYLRLQDIQRLAQIDIKAGEGLFDSLLVFENYPVDAAIAQYAAGSGLNVTDIQSFEGTNYGITVVAHLTDKLALKLEVQEQLMSALDAEQIAGHLKQLLLNLTQDTEQPVGHINMLSENEASQLRTLHNDTQVVDYVGKKPQDYLLHQLFIEQAQLTPDAIAVIDDKGELSYQALFSQAYQLHLQLLSYDLQHEELVGVLLPKGRDQVIATLAIMMAGGAYLPLSLSWPDKRCLTVLERGGCRYLISHQGLMETAGQVTPVYLDGLALSSTRYLANPLASNFVYRQQPDNLAYVIFTSGSTGAPKGVAIEHQMAVNTLLDINAQYQVTAADKVLAVSALSFDLSVYDLFGLLAAGGTIVFPEEDRATDPAHWLSLIEHHQVTLWDTVPASAGFLAAQVLLENRSTSTAPLRNILMSGDWIPTDLPAKLWQVFTDVNVYSLGGATEGSVWSIHYPIKQDLTEAKSIPYGKPLSNQQFYVMDEQFRLLPQGAIGEMFIGGEGVARGYYGDTDLTNERFITHPEFGLRLYRTGDLGRYFADGNLEFIGRADDQVKIRGFRIELGEIEHQLSLCEGVESAVVLAREDQPGQQRLVAYVQVVDDLSGSSLSGDSLSTKEENWIDGFKQTLGSSLPTYMMPSAFVIIEDWPLSANNKVDKKALPIPDTAALTVAYMAPVSDVEKQLCQIWQDVLGVAQVGIGDNFFDIGGDSISVMKLVFAIKQGGLMVSAKDIFSYQSIKALAPQLSQIAAQNPDEQQQLSEPYALPGNRHWYFSRTKDLGLWGQSYVLQFERSDNLSEPSEQAVQYLLNMHEGLRIQMVGDNRQEVIAAIDSFKGYHYQDLSSATDEQIEACIAEFQTSVDLSESMVKFLYCDLGEHRQDQLVVVVHHLAVEQYSQTIIVTDFIKAFNAYLHGQKPNINRIGNSFGEWVTGMDDWLHTDEAAQNIAFWQQKLAHKVNHLPTDQPFSHQRNAIGTREGFDIALTVEQTEQLQQSAKQQGYQEFDLILTAMAKVFANWSNSETFCYELVTTGREHFEHLDLSGTVGWLNDYIPVFIDVAQGIDGVSQALKDCTEYGKGFSHLKYKQAEVLPEYDISGLYNPEIAINYIPRSLNDVQQGQADPAQTGFSVLRVDNMVGNEREAIHKMGCQIVTTDECLVFSWNFGGLIYDRSTVEGLGEACREALLGLM